MTNKGIHILLDFSKQKNIQNNVKEIEENSIFSKNLIEYMIYTCKNNGIKVLGHQLEVFDGSKSPHGFASVILLDESHLSAHCYSNEGMLAVDIFTCGCQDRGIIVANLIKQYILENSSYILQNEIKHLRFIN
jgi:S-adenosylmethionine decarboxylase